MRPCLARFKPHKTFWKAVVLDRVTGYIDLDDHSAKVPQRPLWPRINKFSNFGIGGHAPNRGDTRGTRFRWEGGDQRMICGHYYKGYTRPLNLAFFWEYINRTELLCAKRADNFWSGFLLADECLALYWAFCRLGGTAGCERAGLPIQILAWVGNGPPP